MHISYVSVMKSKSVKVNAVLNGLRTVLNLLFPLVTFPYISRVLSIEEIGKYNFSMSIVSYFMLIAALGIDKYAVREGTKYRDNKVEMSDFASEVFSVNILATVLSYLLLLAYIWLSSKAYDYRFCIIIFSFQIFFTTIGTEWLYTIYEEYEYITVRSILFKLISIALLFVFVRNEGDYLKYACITVFSSVGSNILNFINSKKYCTIRIRFKANWKKILTPVLVIFASNVAVQIYVNSDITILGYLKDDYSVGIYSIAAKIYLIVKNVLVAILTVTIPRLSLYVGKGLTAEYRQLLKKITNTIVVLGLPTMVGLILLSRNAILIISSEKYIGSQKSLIILCLAIIFSLFSTIFNQCVLLPYKREKVFLRSSVISASVNIILNLCIVPFLGAAGAAITTLLSEALMAIMNCYGAKDIITGYLFDKSFLFNAITAGVGCIGIVFWVIFIKAIVFSILLQTFFAVCGAVVAYFSLLILCKNEMAIKLLISIKEKVNIRFRNIK